MWVRYTESLSKTERLFQTLFKNGKQFEIFLSLSITPIILNMKFLYAFTLLIGFALSAFAQRIPKKSLDLPAIKQAIDSLTLSADLTLSFNFNTSEVRGNIETKAQTKAKDDKRRQEAEKKFQQDPTNLKFAIELFELLSDTTLQYAQGQVCLNLLEQKLKENPQDGNLYFDAGKIFHRVSKYEQAMQYYTYANKLMPDSAKVYQKAGEILFNAQLYEQAKEAFGNVLKADNSLIDAQMLFIMADVFVSMNSLIAKSKAEPESNIAKWAESLVLDISKLEEATRKYSKREDLVDLKHYIRFFWIFYKGFMLGVSSVDTKNLDFTKRENITINNLFKVSESDIEELKILEKEIAKLIKDKNIKNPALAYEALGMIGIMTGNNKKALQHLKEAMKLNPEKVANYYNTAFIYFMQKEDANVEEMIRKKIAIEPSAADYTKIAAVYDYSKQHTKAKAVCIEGIKNLADKTVAEIYYTLGVLEARTGNYTEASSAFTNVLQSLLETQDKFPKTVYAYALVELAQQNWDNAYYLLKKGAEKEDKNCTKLMKDYFE